MNGSRNTPGGKGLLILVIGVLLFLQNYGIWYGLTRWLLPVIVILLGLIVSGGTPIRRQGPGHPPPPPPAQ